MAERVKTTAVAMSKLVAKRKRLMAIPERKRTPEQRADLLIVNRKITIMTDAKTKSRKTEGGRAAAAAAASKTAGQLNPERGNVPERSGPQVPKASPDAPLKHASKKAREAAEEKGKKKRAAEKKKTAEKMVPTTKSQTPAQRRAAKSFPGAVVAATKSNSVDPLGSGYTAAMAAKKKRDKAERRKTALTVDPTPSKIDTFVVVNRDENGSIIQPKESSVTSKQTESVQSQIDEAESDGPYGPIAGRKAIQGFFRDTFGFTPTVKYTFPGDDGEDTPQGRKSGGKVTPKRAPTKKPAKSSTSSTKKYAMNKGGKVASVRKPTRA